MGWVEGAAASAANRAQQPPTVPRTSAIADRLTPFEEFNRFVGLEQAVGVEARYESGKEA